VSSSENRDERLFLDAMASFPSGVTIVTTTDAEGRWSGFTATSFCSVSVNPPLVLTCLATSAECHPVFERAHKWVVHIIHAAHAHLAIKFATRGADKFGETGFVADDEGLPVLDGASVTLRCSAFARYAAGDHTILVGHVDETQIDHTELPALYFRRNFRSLGTASRWASPSAPPATRAAR
jgi:flavin reductase ActVB